MHRICAANEFTMKTSTIPSLRVASEQRDFIARGLASRDEAKHTGEYYDADDVLAELDTMLAVRHQREDDYF